MYPPPFRHHNHDTQLVMAEQELRREREAFFTIRADANFLRAVLADLAGGDPLPAKLVRGVLGEAHTLAMECPIRSYEPGWHFERAFLDRLGFTADRRTDAAWPRDRFLAALDYNAGATEWPADEFWAGLLRSLDSRTDGFARRVKRRETEIVALKRRMEAEVDRWRQPYSSHPTRRPIG